MPVPAPASITWWTVDGRKAAVGAMSAAAKVLCDWGSTRLRAFLDVGGVVSERLDGPGIHRLDGQTPVEALMSALAGWRSRHKIEAVVLCGMAGSRNGIAEAPYVRAPATLAAWRGEPLRLRIDGLALTIAAGVQAENLCAVADVMRGEETQVYGALELEPALASGSHWIVLPGTHSKWVEVRDGAIARVQTYFTGELFDLLDRYSSLLRAGADEGTEQQGFEAGLGAAARGGLAAGLFQVRSAQLLEERTAGWARAFLSGLLIGAELDSVLVLCPLVSRAVTLIGEPKLISLYRRALASRHIGAQALDGEGCVLAGLRALQAEGT